MSHTALSFPAQVQDVRVFLKETLITSCGVCECSLKFACEALGLWSSIFPEYRGFSDQVHIRRLRCVFFVPWVFFLPKRRKANDAGGHLCSVSWIDTRLSSI